MKPIVINNVNDFINFACDFKEFMNEEQRERNPYTLTEKERTELVEKVLSEDPDKFTRYGYHIKDNGELIWSLEIMRIARKN